MAVRKCAECAVESENVEGWVECPACGKVYCETCIDGERKEKDKLDTLRKGNTRDRLNILCPTCESELVYMQQ